MQSSKVNKTFKDDMLNALNDDLNTSKALAVIDELLTVSNDKLDANPKDKNLKKELQANFEFISEILGFAHNDPYSYFQFGINEETLLKIETLIEKRSEAKKEKNFELSDQIRDELKLMDISIMDTPSGVVWEKL